ncbi:uncharacterized protein LOC141857210 isoform X1 [Brevipalpus obovatus]|uniref:uncharacterized protein LOC141857210 isoform X1 n=1 Tax=Brevipalpus obovatus TaxID=246614 RepID=UPI003D9F92A1
MTAKELYDYVSVQLHRADIVPTNSTTMTTNMNNMHLNTCIPNKSNSINWTGNTMPTTDTIVYTASNHRVADHPHNQSEKEFKSGSEIISKSITTQFPPDSDKAIVKEESSPSSSRPCIMSLNEGVDNTVTCEKMEVISNNIDKQAPKASKVINGQPSVDKSSQEIKFYRLMSGGRSGSDDQIVSGTTVSVASPGLLSPDTPRSLSGGSDVSTSSSENDSTYEESISEDDDRTLVSMDKIEQQSIDESNSCSDKCNSSSCSSSSSSGNNKRPNVEQDVVVKRCSNYWKSVRNAVRWSPFVRIYKKRRYPWVQLAGHQANFRSGGPGTVLKRACGEEENCLRKLMKDPLRQYVPEFKAKVNCGDEDFLELEDLLAPYEIPCVMDIKVGIRTYREKELIRTRDKPSLRKDLYEKMIGIDPNEPTEEERKQGAIIKSRYMIWRESISSTANLGFRIDGIKFKDEIASVDYKTLKNEEEIMQAIKKFAGDDLKIIVEYQNKLKSLRKTLVKSPFFNSHEIIGSSLLFIHDHRNEAGIWMIDFAKTYPLPPGVEITHDSKWEMGNHEDGYLIGIDNLIRTFDNLMDQSSEENKNSSSCSSSCAVASPSSIVHV